MCCSYENLLLPRHTPKKNSRGSPKVGRQKTSVTGIRIFKRKNTVTETASSVRQDEVNQASKSTCSGGEKFGYTQPSISAPTASKSQKHVRFDEDSEWMDISDEEVLDFLEGEEDSGIFMLDDEYVLL
jgi:hypothetical protein